MSASLVLGGVFVWAGVLKALTPEAMIPAVGAGLPSGLLGLRGALAVVCFLAAVEIGLGLGIVFMRSKSRWVVIASALLCVYSVYLAWLLTLPSSPRCGCLGVRLGATPTQEHWAGILRNIGLLSLATMMLRAPVSPSREPATAGGS